MALLLIKAINRLGSSYIKGDIVDIREADSKLGRRECLPNFLFIKVPGLRKDLLYLADNIDGDDYDIEAGGFLVERKRKYCFDIEAKVSKEQMSEIELSEDWLFFEYPITDIYEWTK